MWTVIEWKYKNGNYSMERHEFTGQRAYEKAFTKLMNLNKRHSAIVALVKA